MFNEALLLPYHPSTFPNQPQSNRPAPELVDEVPEYEVEYIVDHQMKGTGRRAKREYLVHWRGYPKEERTWEPEKNLGNAQDAVREYLDQHVELCRAVFGDPWEPSATYAPTPPYPMRWIYCPCKEGYWCHWGSDRCGWNYWTVAQDTRIRDCSVGLPDKHLDQVKPSSRRGGDS